jgi:hypothetical protein
LKQHSWVDAHQHRHHSQDQNAKSPHAAYTGPTGNRAATPVLDVVAAASFPPPHTDLLSVAVERLARPAIFDATEPHTSSAHPLNRAAIDLAGPSTVVEVCRCCRFVVNTCFAPLVSQPSRRQQVRRVKIP